jgi:hypothetical protein
MNLRASFTASALASMDWDLAAVVKHWEGDTMTIDITRKVPPGDLFYQWYGR